MHDGAGCADAAGLLIWNSTDLRAWPDFILYLTNINRIVAIANANANP